MKEAAFGGNAAAATRCHLADFTTTTESPDGMNSVAWASYLSHAERNSRIQLLHLFEPVAGARFDKPRPVT